MKTDCGVIRDLLPLYADDACSEQSRALVSEHLLDCENCRRMLYQLKENEIETSLKQEKAAVIQHGAKRFRQRSAAVGSAISGVFAGVILLCLIICTTVGTSMDWFDIVLASLCVAASVIVVPLIVPEDKLFWTFCAFCASLMILLAVICLHSHGAWFWIASSASLFGLAAVFLPFVIRSRPAQKLLGNNNPWIIVIGLDVALFINMMNMISAHGKLTLGTILFSVGVFLGVGLVVREILRRKKSGE